MFLWHCTEIDINHGIREHMWPRQERVYVVDPNSFDGGRIIIKLFTGTRIRIINADPDPVIALDINKSKKVINITIRLIRLISLSMFQ